MHIRPYQPNDKAALLALMRQHIPEFFAPAEAADFAEYLEKHREEYFVLEHENQIVACGGINYFPADRLARLSWDIVHPEAMGKGFGKALVDFRIQHISRQPGMDTLVVRTSQLAFKFYEKCGFQLKSIKKDFWAEELDLYYMEMPTTRIP